MVDEVIVSIFTKTLSSDGTKFKKFVSVTIELHKILTAFGQTPLALSFAQVSSPPLITHTNNGFESFKEGRFSSAY